MPTGVSSEGNLKRLPVDSLKNHPWRLSYSTSAHLAGGKPIDILHDFYIPALQRAVRYDRVAGYKCF